MSKVMKARVELAVIGAQAHRRRAELAQLEFPFMTLKNETAELEESKPEGELDPTYHKTKKPKRRKESRAKPVKKGSK